MSECVFCKIATGELPSRKVREDGHFLAFYDLDPKAETHVLVMPREHLRDLDEFAASGGDGTATLRFISDTARALGVEGRYRVIANVGEAAGQTVHHLHWHILAGPHLPGFH